MAEEQWVHQSYQAMTKSLMREVESSIPAPSEMLSTRDDRSGTIPIPSECYSTRDDRLEPSSQHRTAEPTLLLHPDQHPTAEVRDYRDRFFLSPPRLKPYGYRVGFRFTAHVCGTVRRGVVTDRVYRIHPSPPGRTGQFVY